MMKMPTILLIVLVKSILAEVTVVSPLSMKAMFFSPGHFFILNLGIMDKES